MTRKWALLSILSALWLAAPPAHATTLLTAQDILKQFNAVIFGNFTSTSDVEGRTVIGGNMTGGATFNLNPGSAAASSFSALTVYGNETSSGTFNINNGGSVTVVGSNAGTYNLNGNGSVSIGGANSGNINGSNSNGTFTVGGSNTGTITTGAGSSVFVSGNNSGGISSGGGSVAVVGSNSANVTVNSSGSIYTGSNSGNMSLNGNGNVSVNGSNTNQVTVNGSGNVAINGNSGNVNVNGGSVTYAGSRTGNINANGGATVTQGAVSLTPPTSPATTPSSFTSTFQAPMTALSTQLSQVTANSVATHSGNQITFNATPNSSGVAVFDVNTSLFGANSTVTLNLNGATSVIINVNVDSCINTTCAFTFPSSVNFTNPTSYADYVLWNFINATGLTFPNEFGGTVLAPLAVVTNSGPIDGTVVAAGLNGNGELHSHPYQGTLPNGQVNDGGGPSPVPEPATLLLLAGGFGSLAVLRRRRPSRPSA